MRLRIENCGLRIAKTSSASARNSIESPTVSPGPFHTAPPPRRAGSPAKRGFTLTEILIVIALIVLFITLALPAFNLISGGRSIAGGTNLVSAFIGRARAEAIGLQQTRGVAFYVDAATGKSTMAIVQQPLQSPNIASTFNSAATYPAGTYITYSGRYYVAIQNLPIAPSTTVVAPLIDGPPATDNGSWSEVDTLATDAAPDSDTIPLPMGVGAQLISDSVVNTVSSGSFSANRYMSFGAILFDSTGNLVSKQISLPHLGIIGQRFNMGTLTQNLPNLGGATPANNPKIFSQVGVVLFDLSAYGNTGGVMTPQSTFLTLPPLTRTVPVAEATQETWLDHNSTPLLVSRYSGTLIPAQ